MAQSTQGIRDLYQKYVMPVYAPDTVLVKGKGSYVWDSEGRRFLDFAMGISVCNLGHCHPAIAEAVARQAQQLVHVSNLYMNDVTPRLAQKLISFGMDGVVFFCNSGAEANEGMIKFARKFGSDKGKYEIISMVDSFHGRTLATLAATGRAKYRKGFAPDVQGFVQVPYNDIEAIRSAISEQTVAVMLEPVQGEGGILPADPAYLAQVRQLCDEKGLLMLFDEVQCGMGRTGELFAYRAFGVEPDAVSMAKAIANGLPMGAFIVQRKHQNVLKVGEHASTFGGTPLVSSAAMAVLETIEKENLLENCRKMGAYLQEGLKKISAPYSFVKGVRGKGLMIGVVLNKSAAALRAAALKRGLIVLTAGESVLRLLPPLNLKQSEADEALEILAQALSDAAPEYEVK